MEKKNGILLKKQYSRDKNVVKRVKWNENTKKQDWKKKIRETKSKYVKERKKERKIRKKERKKERKAGEETRWQLHKNAACNPEQVLAATPNKTPTVRPPAPYHENYSS